MSLYDFLKTPNWVIPAVGILVSALVFSSQGLAQGRTGTPVVQSRPATQQVGPSPSPTPVTKRVGEEDGDEGWATPGDPRNDETLTKHAKFECEVELEANSEEHALACNIWCISQGLAGGSVTTESGQFRCEN